MKEKTYSLEVWTFDDHVFAYTNPVHSERVHDFIMYECLVMYHWPSLSSHRIKVTKAQLETFHVARNLRQIDSLLTSLMIDLGVENKTPSESSGDSDDEDSD